MAELSARLRVFVVRARRPLAWALGVFVCVSVILWAVVASGTLIDTRRFVRPDDSVTVFDRAGRPLRHARIDGADRRWVPLTEISPVLLNAVIATEDGDFYRHHGVDLKAISRSAARNLLPWTRLSGASTITQQLVKRVYGRRGGVFGKFVEALRALSLERTLTKDEILEQYLNRLPFGDGIEGAERASQSYFGHSAAVMTVAEAALLAGIPQAPSSTEPRRHLGRALARRETVLARMLTRGVIDRGTYDSARREQPVIVREEARPWEAPRFVDEVLHRWRAGTIQRNGHRIDTSLDVDIQRRAETLLQSAVARFESRGARNGAAVVVANATGEVVAYVGAARDTARDSGGALDLLRARRQPGSTLKSFIYELFFERGGTAATVLDDVVQPLRGARGSFFEARDYDRGERGPVRARVALGSSLNLAALDASGRAGSEHVVRRLKALGFQVEGDASQYGAAVVLGGADVTALELARAYMALARGGTTVALGYTPSPQPRVAEVMTPAAAAITWDVLSDGEVRADAFGSDLRDLAGGRVFALKTGTSSNWRDAWCAVATRRFTVVVWLGDPSGAPMSSVSGFEASAPTAVRILAEAERIGAGFTEATPPVARLVEAPVCAWSGLRAGARCRHVVVERFSPETLPRDTCESHDAEGHYILPRRYAAWVERQHPAGVVVGAESDRVTTATVNVPVIIEPRNGARWLLDPGRALPTIRPRASVQGVEERDVTWEIDGQPLTTERWTATPGAHTFVAIHHGARSAAATLEVSVAR
jgi:penicillin-binding protein 1C